MKVILITGASRGIGRGIAEYLAKGENIIIANYNKSEIQANQLKEKYPNNIELYKADVSKRNEIEEMIAYIINKYKKIDVLINNAGIDQYKLFTDITDNDWNKMITTNLYSVFCCTQEVVKNMIHEKNGCIINISSVWGIVGGAMETHYSASKAGILGLTKALAKELGPSNIRVNAIAPGIIDTEMNNNLTLGELEDLKNETPLERIGTPKDIAKCVNWLIEDTFTTGQVISLNGGWIIT